MFKKATSFILSLVFVLTAFGVSTLFGGVIGAEAVYYDYYTYISLPGWGAFSDADLAELYHPGAEGAQVAAPANAPERVTSATAFTVTNSKPGSYVGYVNLCSYVFYNPADTDNIQWCAKDTPSSGKTITDGYDFGEDSGICFWVGRNDGNCTDPVKINLFIVPAKGTAYSGSDPVMIENPMGFCFEATVRPDEDGYVYYDFKTDFSQIDWFWNHDDGKNYSIYNGYSKRPCLTTSWIRYPVSAWSSKTLRRTTYTTSPTSALTATSAYIPTNSKKLSSFSILSIPKRTPNRATKKRPRFI